MAIAIAMMAVPRAAKAQGGAQAGGGGAAANAPANAAPKLYESAADMTALWDNAKRNRKEGQTNFVQNMLTLAPYSVNLEYRAAVGTATIHQEHAELFYVVDGSATMVTGGKLVDGKHTNEDNYSGSAIEGGTSREIGKGDFILVPENTPHWFSRISGTLVLMSLHVPRPTPGSAAVTTATPTLAAAR